MDIRMRANVAKQALGFLSMEPNNVIRNNATCFKISD